MQTSYVQLAPDSTGKKVVMEQVTQADGTTAYRQVAVLDGEATYQLGEIAESLKTLIHIQRAILAVANNAASNPIFEQDAANY